MIDSYLELVNTIDSHCETLTTIFLEADERFELVISNKGTGGYVIADAVQLVTD